MKSLIYVIFFFFSTFAVNAQTHKNNPTAAVAEKDVTNEDFRCERVMGMGLAEFKSKLVENCNLNKPFSSSLSSMLNEVNYFYCCQKKK